VEEKPDYELAREELEKAAIQRGFVLVTYPARIIDKKTFRVAVDFKLSAGKHERTGTWKAGCNTAARHMSPAFRCRDALAAFAKGARTLDSVEAFERSVHTYAPPLVDVLWSMLSDVNGWPAGGFTFREWLAEGLADGLNAADALDTFQEIEKEWRFLQRACPHPGDLETLCQIAGRM